MGKYNFDSQGGGEESVGVSKIELSHLKIYLREKPGGGIDAGGTAFPHFFESRALDVQKRVGLKNSLQLHSFPRSKGGAGASKRVRDSGRKKEGQSIIPLQEGKNRNRKKSGSKEKGKTRRNSSNNQPQGTGEFAQGKKVLSPRTKTT